MATSVDDVQFLIIQDSNDKGAVNNITHDGVLSHSQLVVRGHAEGEPTNLAMSILLPGGAPCILLIERLTGDTAVIAKHVRESILPMVAHAYRQPFKYPDSNRDSAILEILNQKKEIESTNEVSFNLSVGAVQNVADSTCYQRQFSGFVTGTAKFYLKGIGYIKDGETIKYHQHGTASTAKDFTTFNEQVLAGQHIVGVLGVDSKVLTCTDVVGGESRDNPWNLNGFTKENFKFSGSLAAVAAQVLDHSGHMQSDNWRAAIANCTQLSTNKSKQSEPGGSGRSDVSASSTVPLLPSFFSNVSFATVPPALWYGLASVIICSAVLAIADTFGGDPITNLMNDRTNDHWFDGDIGKHAASGFAFPGALTAIVGVGCLFYYGGAKAYAACRSSEKPKPE